MRMSEWSSDVCSSDRLLLDMPLKDLERVLYFENYIVIEPGLTPLTKFQLLNEDELMEAQDEHGEDDFTAGIGAEAVRKLLEEQIGRASCRERVCQYV